MRYEDLKSITSPKSRWKILALQSQLFTSDIFHGNDIEGWKSICIPPLEIQILSNHFAKAVEVRTAATTGSGGPIISVLAMQFRKESRIYQEFKRKSTYRHFT